MDKDELDKLLIKVLKGEITSTHQIPCDDFISCKDCPFSYDSKLNEKHVGCTCLSQEEINDIARRFLNGEER